MSKRTAAAHKKITELVKGGSRLEAGRASWSYNYAVSQHGAPAERVRAAQNTDRISGLEVDLYTGARPLRQIQRAKNTVEALVSSGVRLNPNATTSKTYQRAVAAADSTAAASKKYR